MTQVSTHGPGEPMLPKPTLNREVGPDDLETTLPTSAFLRTPDPFLYITKYLIHFASSTEIKGKKKM